MWGSPQGVPTTGLVLALRMTPGTLLCTLHWETPNS